MLPSESLRMILHEVNADAKENAKTEADRIETLKRELAASESRVNELLMDVAGKNFRELPSVSFREAELERELAVYKRRWETVERHSRRSGRPNNRRYELLLWCQTSTDTFAEAVDGVRQETTNAD